MRRTTAILTALLFTAACGGTMNADDFRSGLPGADTVKLELPGDSGQALTAEDYGSLEQALEGEISDTYRVTRGVTRWVNGGVGLVLIIVRGITLHRPTTMQGNTAIWGPFTPDLEPITWKLTVTHTGGQTFDYVLEGQPKAGGDWEVVLSGTHTRILGEGGVPRERFGSGSFMLDWEARGRLPERNGKLTGTTVVEYAHLSDTDPVDISVQFNQATDENSGRQIDVSYRYRRDPVSGGEFEFLADSDVDGQARLEQLSVKSRWQTTGAGRSDVRAVGGDLAEGAEATLSECWDDLFASRYMAASFSADAAHNYGVEASDCAFATASFSSL